ncbi:MAG: Grx4 family monothiol glutaredoxin [Bdellovibrionales bacterium]|nr:Grx4 family monothiol glutaredoxin [Bdellovibrionales bacterium]
MAHPLISKVEEKVKGNPVMIFMKGTPEFPQCGFSARAVQVLKAAGAEKMGAVDVLSDDPLWDALEEYTKWPTVPQIFINGQFVGGCDIVTELYERGELQDLLAKKS